MCRHDHVTSSFLYDSLMTLDKSDNQKAQQLGVQTIITKTDSLSISKSVVLPSCKLDTFQYADNTPYSNNNVYTVTTPHSRWPQNKSDTVNHDHCPIPQKMESQKYHDIPPRAAPSDHIITAMTMSVPLHFAVIHFLAVPIAVDLQTEMLTVPQIL